jgi:hypothetical protein
VLPDVKAGGCKRGVQIVPEFVVKAADEDALAVEFAVLPVNRNDSFRTLDDRQAMNLLESTSNSFITLLRRDSDDVTLVLPVT